MHLSLSFKQIVTLISINMRSLIIAAIAVMATASPLPQYFDVEGKYSLIGAISFR